MSEQQKVSVQQPSQQPQSLALSLTLTAVILYFPANIYPFMTIEMYGLRNTSTVWGGIVSLFEKGSWGIAIVIFLASMVIPILKLLILFYLTLTTSSRENSKMKLRLYKFVEAIGRWSMLDIFLLAVVVAVFKFGRMARVEPGPGSWLFLLVVIFTMMASAVFDPKSLGEPTDDKD